MMVPEDHLTYHATDPTNTAICLAFVEGPNKGIRR
jgi:hypothetical protein